jgi:hypothetical protein
MSDGPTDYRASHPMMLWRHNRAYGCAGDMTFCKRAGSTQSDHHGDRRS